MVAITDPRQLRDQHTLRGADKPQREVPFAGFVFERAVTRDVFRLRGKALDAHRAAHAMGGADRPDTDAFLGCAHDDLQQRRPADQPRAAAAASSASLARAWALAFGVDLSGVSRTAGLPASPASPRKRATRSVGCAPTPSQCLIRSSLSVTRSAWPRSSIGL